MTGNTPEMHALFLALNRNKRSVLLDAWEGAENLAKQVAKLVAWADVVVVDAANAKLFGLDDAAAISAQHPGLIFAEVQASGSELERQMAVGMCGSQLDEVNLKPSPVKTMVCDKASALYIAFAIESALFARLRSGAGQIITLYCARFFWFVQTNRNLVCS
jgi:crotonobetainyl-CoA:carnitine CoA-transferase CaiB-like acyl-CoA transferase